MNPLLRPTTIAGCWPFAPHGICALAMALVGASLNAANLSTDSNTARHRGVCEVKLKAQEALTSPFFDGTVQIKFTRPDQTKVTADAFYRGSKTWIVRAYCDTIGKWVWRCNSNLKSLNTRSGSFEVVPSHLPGKLRKHPQDPHQFAYDNGDWFLHIGDTGYRYVTDTEPLWQ
jgi:hypothetical protein